MKCHIFSEKLKIKMSSAAIVISTNSSPTSGDFCCLLITFNLCKLFGPNVGPDLDPKLFDTLMIFLKDFFEKKFI